MLGSRIKLSAYADDLLFYCDSSNDAEVIFKCFDNTRKATGSCLNIDKTKILNLGRKIINNDFVTDRITICGIEFSEIMTLLFLLIK